MYAYDDQYQNDESYDDNNGDYYDDWLSYFSNIFVILN